MDLSNFFNARSIAIVGVSREPSKVGHAIFKNLLNSGFEGKIFIVNPNADEILDHKSYKSVSSIKEKVNLAIIAVPSDLVIKVIKDCSRKGIKDVVIISSGFKEIGNYKLENKLKSSLKKHKIRCIGPNCLGIYNAHNNIDTLFLPLEKMKRPKPGDISFICQSGALGAALLDFAAEENYGFAKFISYGNAENIDESDILEYLANDKETKVICLYIEGVKNGKKFLETSKKVSKTKPIIAIKAGTTEAGKKAALSHTGSLAGSSEIYSGVFKQANIIAAETLEEMFDLVKLLDKLKTMPRNNRIQVITNGGGYGILAADSISKNNLSLAIPSKKTIDFLKSKFQSRHVISNPMDLLGDATTDMYKTAIESCLKDSNIDILVIIILYQTPSLSTDITSMISGLNAKQKKPIVIISTGSKSTKDLRLALENNSIPCFNFPENAIKSIKKLVDYCNRKNRLYIKK
ncbi:CoA-binding protein [Candidatus Woesearchaeota archaeon]|nr:CoA-binding protein [Candidatus Woesearchaeota archaeon]